MNLSFRGFEGLKHASRLPGSSIYDCLLAPCKFSSCLITSTVTFLPLLDLLLSFISAVCICVTVSSRINPPKELARSEERINNEILCNGQAKPEQISLIKNHDFIFSCLFYFYFLLLGRTNVHEALRIIVDFRNRRNFIKCSGLDDFVTQLSAAPASLVCKTQNFHLMGSIKREICFFLSSAIFLSKNS